MPLAPETKEKWVAALRGGGYKQTQGNLRSGDAFCCLGVFCDLTSEGVWTRSIHSEIYLYRMNVGDEYNTRFIPSKMRERHGLPFDKMLELAAWNDDGKSFAEIASYIEEHL
jgi:hypothetical protein